MTAELSPDDTKKSLFFSYSHGDREIAQRIVSGLEARGYRVWWDDHLDGGSAYAERIATELADAEKVIVLWSPRSIASHWVIDEAQEGRDRGALVPLCIDGQLPPLGFRQFQTIEMDRWDGDVEAPAFQRLLRSLGEDVPDTAVKRKVTRGVPRRVVLIGGAAVVAAGSAGLAAMLMRGGQEAVDENSLAVLPFRNLSGDPDQDYLSAGIAADVRLALARNAALRVVAQASSEAVRERALRAADIARELSVSVFLDGHVQYRNGRVRVATELIDGTTGFTRWAEEFDRPAEDTPLIHSAIAQAVTRELSAGEVGGSEYGETESAAAYDNYLKGQQLYASAISYETDLSALAMLEQAVAQDPDFGAAHAAKARTLTVLGNQASSPAEAQPFYQRAYDAARTAVAAGPRSADAHSTLGYVLFQAQLRIRDAAEPYRQSYALGQGEATVLARYAAYAASTGAFAEARQAVDRARDLDPLNAGIHRAAGYVRYAEGKYAESIEFVRRALELNPVLSDSHARIALAQLMLENLDEAKASADQERSGLIGLTARAIVAAALGDGDAADAQFADLIERFGDAGLYQQAQILARRSRTDEAMERLRKAKVLGDSGLTYVFIDPMLNSLRNREDYRELISELGYA